MPIEDTEPYRALEQIWKILSGRGTQFADEPMAIRWQRSHLLSLIPSVSV
jgi:hypothetical protein